MSETQNDVELLIAAGLKIPTTLRPYIDQMRALGKLQAPATPDELRRWRKLRGAERYRRRYLRRSER